MAKPKSLSRRSLLIRILASVVLLVAALYVLFRNWHMVRSSIDAAGDANLGWLALALMLMVVTFCTAAGVYGVLALHPLRYRQTVLVEIATAFVNKLLPAGIGGLGLHGVYLYGRKHTAAEATVVVSMNNLLGMTAHLLILAGMILVYPSVLGQLLRRQHVSLNSWVFVAVLLMVGVVFAVPVARRRIASFVSNLLQSTRKIRSVHVVRAMPLAMLLTVTYTLILFATARAVGVHLGALQVFVVFSIGMLTATASPTPGGLVGAEAGLFAGFVAYGVASAPAGAAVLLYRLITYWLPLIPGAVALIAARRSKLV